MESEARFTALHRLCNHPEKRLMSTPSSFWTDAAKALIPVTPAFLVGLLAWGKDLGASSRRIRAIDEATKRTAFWKQWHEAVSTLNLPELESRFSVRSELTDAAEMVSVASRKSRAVVGSINASGQRNGWLRRFLLMDRALFGVAVWYRLAFWLYVALFFFGLGLRAWKYHNGHGVRYWLLTVLTACSLAIATMMLRRKALIVGYLLRP
jgi:hypothetical protein